MHWARRKEEIRKKRDEDNIKTNTVIVYDSKQKNDKWKNKIKKDIKTIHTVAKCYKSITNKAN